MIFVKQMKHPAYQQMCEKPQADNNFEFFLRAYVLVEI